MSHDPFYIAFVKFKSNLLRLAGRLLQNPDDASDAVQETFCRLWPLKDQVQTEQEATALAVRTTRNICIDKLRRDNRIRFDRWEETTPAEPVPPVDEQLEQEETFRTVRRIVEEHLTERQKIIFEMKEIDGYEIDEIARRLQMQPAAVRMNLSRARQEIRNQYKRIVEHET